MLHLLVSLLCWGLGIVCLTAAFWLLDQLGLDDGFVKSTARGLLATLAVGLFGGGSYAATPPVDAGAVRPVFRLLGGVLGPLLMLTGSFISFIIAQSLLSEGWDGWSGFGLSLLGTGLGSILVGVLFFRAAWTGRDPYVRW
jgi:hypothetical protein